MATESCCCPGLVVESKKTASSMAADQHWNALLGPRSRARVDRVGVDPRRWPAIAAEIFAALGRADFTAGRGSRRDD